MSDDANQFYGEGDFAREKAETEPYRKHRSPWRRDYTRLIHTPAFRRMQHKTQLFPGENDFFRNRLTHSLEVAQIAKSITQKINYENFENRSYSYEDYQFRISTDLVEFAALAHDIGHPPFGHNGEHALDECMVEHGGFEGNAQTLRIISKLEKRKNRLGNELEFSDGCDQRLGLNPTYRTLASVLKYDTLIQNRHQGAKLVKGYYSEEKELVDKIKKNVAPDHSAGKFKTIECQIMDLADDIAYSTYDIEDALKSGLTSPLDILAKIEDNDYLIDFVIRRNARSDSKFIGVTKFNASEEVADLIAKDVELVVEDLKEFVCTMSGIGDEKTIKRVKNLDTQKDLIEQNSSPSVVQKMNINACSNGYIRTHAMSALVAEFIDNIQFKLNKKCPALSYANFTKESARKIETLKSFTYDMQIMSPRLKTVEYRGKRIVKDIFESLDSDRSNMLLPPDWKMRVEAIPNESHRKRTICDFVAGMTDRYALEYYERLFSTTSNSIFKEL